MLMSLILLMHLSHSLGKHFSRVIFICSLFLFAIYCQLLSMLAMIPLK